MRLLPELPPDSHEADQGSISMNMLPISLAARYACSSVIHGGGGADRRKLARLGVAVELIDETLENPDRSTYRFIVAVEQGEGDEKTCFGYVCFVH